MLIKYCPKCKLTKSIADFHKQSSKSDGLRVHCKSCVNEINNIYKKNNKDKISEYNLSSKVKELNRKRNQKYRENNREEINERLSKYRKKNREKLRKYKILWTENNREHLNEWYRNYYKIVGNPSSKRRIKLKNIESDSSKRIDVWEKYKGKCYICEKYWQLKDSWHVDHIIPISPKEGSPGIDTLDNKAVACPKCNIQKSNKIIAELINNK